MSGAQAPSPQGLVTGDELARVPNLGRCELVQGRVVPMSPTGFVHGEIEARFAAALMAFVEPRGLGKVLTGESARGSIVLVTRTHASTASGTASQTPAATPPSMAAPYAAPSWTWLRSS